MNLTATLTARTKSRKAVPFVGAVIIQLALLGIAILVVVVAPKTIEEPQFVGKKTIYLPQKELEHQAAVAEFSQASSQFTLTEVLSVDALLPQTMPEIPSLPMETFSPFENELFATGSEALLQHSGLLGDLSSIAQGSSSINFLGVEAQAERIVIAFDVSRSVINRIHNAGIEMDDLKSETIKLIQSLNSNTLFGVIQFSRAFERYSDFLVPATVSNKNHFGEWLDKNFSKHSGSSGRDWVRESNDGIQSVLRASFQMLPDTIFILSDGSFQTSNPTNNGSGQTVTWEQLGADLKTLQKESTETVTIHWITFGADETDKNELNRLAKLYKGRHIAK